VDCRRETLVARVTRLEFATSRELGRAQGSVHFANLLSKEVALFWSMSVHSSHNIIHEDSSVKTF
jgi:hypothetical protein